MALGYEGYAKIEYDPVGTGVETIFLCTGASIPENYPWILSGSGYGGQIDTPVSEIGIGSPYNYEWSVWDGSFSFELTKKLFVSQINPWIFHRQKPAEITLSTRRQNVQNFARCYWNSISLTASEGSSVSGSVSFSAPERYSYTLGGGYIQNRLGAVEDIGASAWLKSGGDIQALNPLANKNIFPIPYWNTKVKIPDLSPDPINFTSWTMTFTQEVVKFFGCFGFQGSQAGLQAPAYMAVGPMEITFECEYAPIGETSQFTPLGSLPSVDIFLDVRDELTYMKFRNLELYTVNDDIADQSSVVPISALYYVLELVA